MYPGDAESRWPHEVLTDRRVIHAWDEPKAAGRWFLTHLSALRPSRGGNPSFPQRFDALWDTYLLFDRRATWGDTPSGVVSWGFTVMATRQKLAEDLQDAIRRR